MRRFCIAVVISWLGVAAWAVARAQEATEPPQSAPARPVESLKKTPAWMNYLFFFWHLDHLDRTADEQAKLGNESAAAAWRSHEQVVSGLEEREGDTLKQVAYDCLEALEKKDAEIQEAVTDFRNQHPDGAYLTAPLPPELHALWQERIQIIDQRIERLRSLLGDERFQVLDKYVQTTFVAVEQKPVLATAEENVGGSR
jgi:hypothetical protein